MIIGVCGKVAAGKDGVTEYLASQGFYSIDADFLGRGALVERQAALIAQFGTQIYSEKEQGIDRKALGAIVFGSKKALKQLNAITHPYIIAKIHEEIAKNSAKNIAINGALLPYWLIEEIATIIWVEASFYNRFKRALKRDKRGFWFTLKRNLSQLSLSPKLFRQKVDIYSVSNNSDQQNLEHQVEKILTIIKNKEDLGKDHAVES